MRWDPKGLRVRRNTLSLSLSGYSLSLLVSRKNLRKDYLVSGSRFCVTIMKMDEYTTHVEGKMVSFYHDQKSHRMIIVHDGGEYEVTLQRGKAIIDFLKRLGYGEK